MHLESWDHGIVKLWLVTRSVVDLFPSPYNHEDVPFNMCA